MAARTALLLVLVAAGLRGSDLQTVVRAVEQRYNRASTLEADFEQRHLVQGRVRRFEKGHLMLRKPARMRWEYTQPPGKLLVCDGRWVWLYSPTAQQVERMRLKQSDDFRAPLAFLLGRLEFRRLFGSLEWNGDLHAARIQAWPKSDRAPFTRVEFNFDEQFSIRRLVVHAPDATAMEFEFSSERLNVAVPDAAFRFTPPAGVPVAESEQ